MARLFIFLNIFFISFVTNTIISLDGYKPSQPQPQSQSQPLVFSVLKERTTGMYYTTISVGKPKLTINVAICAGGAALWFHCGEAGYNSTTYSHVLCNSTRCKQTHESGCSTCVGGTDPTCGTENVSTCSAFIPAHVLYYATGGTLIQDNVILSTSQSQLLSKKMPMFCIADPFILGFLPKGSMGLIGLGNGSTSFVKTLVSTYKLPFKVALCLPSSKPQGNANASGLVYIGGGPYPKDVSKLLVSTPLINLMETRDVGEDNYYIDLRSIQVNGETLSLNQTLLTFDKKTHWGSTKINTLIPYTRLETSIYKTLVKAFGGNAKRRKAVGPFGDCFSSKSFGKKSTPVISLVLRGGVKWNIYGSNSLVKVKKSVVCLGFLEGGDDRIPIEIGGYQMEDNLVEFDVEASKFSFTSSLLLHNTSCS